MVRSIVGKHPQYYEGILQLRKIESDVKDFVDSEIAKAKIPVAKTVEQEHGLDYYLADNDFTRALGRKLQQYFGGENLITASLVTQKDGKDLYRITVLFRGTGFRKGDIIIYQGEDFEVKLMSKDILLQNVKTGQKVHVKYKDLKNIKKK